MRENNLHIRLDVEYNRDTHVARLVVSSDEDKHHEAFAVYAQDLQMIAGYLVSIVLTNEKKTRK